MRKILIVLFFVGLSAEAGPPWSLREDRWEVPLTRVTAVGWRSIALWPMASPVYFVVPLRSRRERERVFTFLRIVTQAQTRIVIAPHVDLYPAPGFGIPAFFEGEMWLPQRAYPGDITLIDWKERTVTLAGAVELLNTDPAMLCATILFNR